MRRALFHALLWSGTFGFLPGGCVREISDDADTPRARADSPGIDSAAALVVDSLSLPAVSQLPSGDTAIRPPALAPIPTTDGSTAVAVPSGAASSGTDRRPTPIPTPTASAVPRSDTGAVVATASELEQLAGALIVPVQGVQTGQLRDTYTESRGSRVHEAIDIPAPRGTPVLAAIDGKLLKLFSSKPGGLMVYASDPLDRFVMMYGHLDRYAEGLTEGMQLRRGQVIGHVGTTGNAPPNTPHLHFAIGRGRPSKSWWRGTPVNPYPLLTKK
jgi:peptidoglycan LD-endopeptidase LytH